jgi:Coenzyme PQQ synthesis protein D (PqqD)
VELALPKWESLLHLEGGPDLFAPARDNEMFRVSDTIRRTETADGGILLDVHHGRMFCLNVVGAKILELIQQGFDESRIADEISRDYGASKNVVHADVIEFIETLQRHHILRPIRSANVT